MVYILVGGLQLSLNLQIGTQSLELFYERIFTKCRRKELVQRQENDDLEGLFCVAVWRGGVTRCSLFEVLNGHLVNEHVKLAVQLCTRMRRHAHYIRRGVTYSGVFGVCGKGFF